MEFKVGQVWRNGDGELYTIHSIFSPSQAFYPVVAISNIRGVKQTYTQTGRYVSDDKPCGFDLVELVQDVDEAEQEQEESSGKMLDEGGERALFDVLAVQSIVTGLIERKGVKGTLAAIRAIIEARRAL